MITIVLECIDRLNVYNTAAHFSEFAGEEAAESWKEIVNLLYELLGRRTAERSDWIRLCPAASGPSVTPVSVCFHSFTDQGKPV